MEETMTKETIKKSRKGKSTTTRIETHIDINYSDNIEKSQRKIHYNKD